MPPLYWAAASRASGACSSSRCNPLSTTTLELVTQTEFISDVGGFGFQDTVEGLAPADPDELDDLDEDETGGDEFDDDDRRHR